MLSGTPHAPLKASTVLNREASGWLVLVLIRLTQEVMDENFSVLKHYFQKAQTLHPVFTSSTPTKKKETELPGKSSAHLLLVMLSLFNIRAVVENIDCQCSCPL